MVAFLSAWQRTGTDQATTIKKMADILQTTFFKYIFLNKNDDIFIQIPLTCVPKGPLENMSPQV